MPVFCLKINILPEWILPAPFLPLLPKYAYDTSGNSPGLVSEVCKLYLTKNGFEILLILIKDTNWEYPYWIPPIASTDNHFILWAILPFSFERQGVGEWIQICPFIEAVITLLEYFYAVIVIFINQEYVD